MRRAHRTRVLLVRISSSVPYVEVLHVLDIVRNGEVDRSDPQRRDHVSLEIKLALQACGPLPSSFSLAATVISILLFSLIHRGGLSATGNEDSLVFSLRVIVVVLRSHKTCAVL